MTTEELSEKIAETLRGDDCQIDAEGVTQIAVLVQTALAEAEKEKVVALSQQGFLHAAEISGMKDRYLKMIDETRAIILKHTSEGLKAATKAAYEDAAKICEHYGLERQADEIRRRASELK